MNCVIIDDEKLARNLVKEFLEPFQEVQIIGEAHNGTQAIALIEQLKPALVFLDVQMPDMNGFQVLESITHEPSVIFTTAYDQYAIRAFELHAIDYLLKPLNQDRFGRSVERVLTQQESSAPLSQLLHQMKEAVRPHSYSSHFIVQKSNKMINLPVQGIHYIKASGDYSILQTANEEFVSNKSLSHLESRLDPNRFLRIHRSTIVNIEHLAEVERISSKGMSVTMKDGKIFSVSRSYANNIKDKLV